MTRQYTLIGLFAIILLVVSSYGRDLPNNGLVFDDSYVDDYAEISTVETISIALRGNDDPTTNASTKTPLQTTTTTTVVTADTNSTATTLTTTVSTTANVTTITETTSSTTVPPTTATVSTTVPPTTATVSTTVPPTTATVSTTPAASSTTTTTTTVSSTSTTTTQSPSTATNPTPTAAPGRKFDGLSFMGGMILAAGLIVLISLVVRYLRRSNRIPYANLR